MAAPLTAAALWIRPARCGIGAAITALAALCLPPWPAGRAQPGLSLHSDETRHAGELVVAVDKSQVLRLDRSFADLLVGNPEIADVMALTDQAIYVLGKAPGSTSLTIYGRDRSLLAVLDLVVSPDTEGLKRRLHELLPDEPVEVRAINGGLALSGTVSSASRLASILALAERFAPAGVTNLMTVRGSQQVLLKVRFVEVSRTVLKELGLNFNAVEGDFRFTSGEVFLRNPGLVGGLGGLTFGSPFGIGALLGGSLGDVGLDLLFEALEEKGVAKTLAEPNLIALSGDTASFLAGGEFPIEVVQAVAGGGDAAITIEFKEFGVSLAFTPTVLGEGLINLVVSPEVSALDFSVAVRGTPGLTTRRATTTVELRDGEAFAIAGLLQEDFSDTVQQVPVLGDIPILGALLRSSAYQRKETELVIIVEPHLIQPAPAQALATPADRFIPPSDRDLWLFGRIEAPGSGRAAMPRADGAAPGGIAGPYGHIIK